MSADNRSVHTDALETLGTIIGPNEKRDAIHIAVEPVIAGMDLRPGEHVTIIDGLCYSSLHSRPITGKHGDALGIVDPYLSFHPGVKKGERFWLLVYPRKITSLRHVWEHPAFDSVEFNDVEVRTMSIHQKNIFDAKEWMTEWAMEHVSDNSYYDGGTKSKEDALDYAINIGYDHRVGSYEDARDYIDDEWWDNWEIITGEIGDRDTYFSCAC